MKKFLALSLIALPLLSQAATNLVQNGSFEANVLTAGGPPLITNTLSGWTVGTPGIEIRNNTVGKAYDGSNFIELDVVANSSISQQLSTTAGQWYQLSFAYSNRTGVPVDSNGLGWTFGTLSGSAPALAYNNTGDNVWSHYTVNFKATGTSTLLSFVGQGTSDGLGTSLDAVSVTAVPEPQTFALFGIGLLGMGLISLQRKRGADTQR
ncbi:DUF642 domain-containing protein [Roseateles koreensis]|uniref:DUF642 domain-containing protein n=1 Tax=Roseateles koreensis TaxID=2987526 RepID=A0ABT5KUP9_9BURK|nr:DUF642 domain-containing protein [Roseateles koreensis]MDC8786663.1 DUF642 domain-containing protein [Roseateles koreensis]